MIRIPRPQAFRKARAAAFLASASVGALMLSGVTAAHAALVPAASVTGTVLFNLGDRQDLAGFGSIGLTDPRFGSVGFTASGTPFPLLTASAQIGPNNLIPSLFGRGVGAVTYYFEILGPPGEVPVLIDVAGAATALATAGASFAVASRWALYEDVSLLNELAGDEIRSGQLTGAFSQSFSRTVGLTLETNHIYPVFLLADAGAAATALGSNAIADAFVDPLFSFGSGVDPLAYSFVFSEGIGNSRLPSSVPEPGALTLLGASLLSLCLRCRRRTE